MNSSKTQRRKGWFHICSTVGVIVAAVVAVLLLLLVLLLLVLWVSIVGGVHC